MDIGQLFIIGISGKTLTENEAQFITENNIGGIVLFGRNLESPDQLKKLTSQLNSLALDHPLFISIDMEGGRVNRLKSPFKLWPSALEIAQTKTTSEAFDLAFEMGDQLLDLGINLNFSPCVDILTNPKNEVIGNRAFGTEPETVSKYASATARGLIKAGVLPCLKHFPGHGNTLLDSHEALPIEETSLDVLEEREFLAFKKTIRSKAPLVMTSHIVFKEIDSEPVTLSPVMISKLKNEMRFSGLVITDDLGMKAISNNYSIEEVPVKALNAGCDILLYCNDLEAQPVALKATRQAFEDGNLDTEKIKLSIQKVIDIKLKYLN